MNISRRRLLKLLGFGGLGFGGTQLMAFAADMSAKRPPPNVVFIAVDDLRPQLGCYGESYMVTPNLDRFARQGRLFKRHYVQVPICSPSRHALLTGVRPHEDTTEFNDRALRTLPRTITEHPHTMPELFKRSGYYTVAIGKIGHQPDGHIYNYDGSGKGRVEIPFAWDEVGTPVGQWRYGWAAFFAYANGRSRPNLPQEERAPTEAADVSDTGYPDGLIAAAAVAKLQQLKQQQQDTAQPFFLGVGFYKPHLPFCAPKRYWDLYDRDRIPLSPAPAKPVNINPHSWHDSHEIYRKYWVSPETANTEAQQRQLRHGYFAAVSYIDAQIGKVLRALDALRLSQNTIVAIWGDHGWHLNDHAMWGKVTSYEWATRSVFMMRTPRMRKRGRATNGIVESLDLYPTLAELCQLETPPGLGGTSLVPLLNNPSHPGKDRAFSYGHNGRTMRTDRYRIIRYPDGEPLIELYDHQTDPYEKKNIASERPDIVEQLLPQLEADTPTLL